jgi:hypothetical protein
MDYNNFIKSNKGKVSNRKDWDSKKKDFFDKNILPQLSSEPDKEVIRLWKDFNKKADGEVFSGKAKKIEDVPAEKKSEEKGFLDEAWQGTKDIVGDTFRSIPGIGKMETQDVYDFADKASTVGAKMFVSPQLIDKIKGVEEAPMSKEEKDFRATRRGVGRSLSEAFKDSNVVRSITQPEVLQTFPIGGGMLAEAMRQQKRNELWDRISINVLSDAKKPLPPRLKQKQLEDKYPYRPESFGEKVGYGLLGGGIDAVPTFFASKAGLPMKTIMAGMGTLGGFLDIKKKAEAGKELTFDDYQSVFRSGMQGYAMGKVATFTGKYADKFSDKIMGKVAKRQDLNLKSRTYDKLLKSDTMRKMDNVIRTTANTASDTASFGATRLALEGKLPSAEDFVSDMITSLAIYKGMGKASKVDQQGSIGENIQRKLIEIGVKSQNKKENKRIAKEVENIYKTAVDKMKSGQYDEQQAKEFMELNFGILYGKLKGKKQVPGQREAYKEEIVSDKMKILKNREYDAVYGETPEIRKTAMDSIKILSPERADEVQRIIDEDAISAQRYKGQYEDPEKIYKGLDDTYVQELPKELRKIPKERFENRVSQKTEIAIERLVEGMSKNIDKKLDDGIPLKDVDLMEGYERSLFKNLNGGQQDSAYKRTLEILKDKYGLGDNLKYERDYLRNLRRELSERDKVWKRTENQPDAIPEESLISRDEFKRMLRALNKDDSYSPRDKDDMIAELRSRVMHENPKLKNKDEIKGKTAVKMAYESMKDTRWNKAIKDMIEPANKGDKVVDPREYKVRETEIEKAKNLLGEDIVNEIVKKTRYNALPIYESNLKTIKKELGKTGDNFNPKGSKFYLKRLSGQLKYKLQQASRVFENEVSKEYRKLVYDPIIEARGNAKVETNFKLKEFENILRPLNKSSRKRVATFLYSEQPDIIDTLKVMGVKPVKESQLNFNEKKVVEYIRKEMKEYIERVNLSRIASRLKPIDPGEKYFTVVRRLDKFIKEGGDPSQTDIKVWNNDESVKEATKLYSGILRKKNAKNIEISLDLKSIMSGYIKNTVEHIHVSPVSSKVNALIEYNDGKFTMKTQNPGLYRYTREWLNTITGVRNDMLGSPMLDHAVRRVMTNVASASLAYNITTVMSQPEALFNTIIRFPKHMAGALHDLATKGDFAEKHSPELYSRVMDVTVRDTEGGFAKANQKIVDIGMYPMKKVDAMAAKLHWYAKVRYEEARRDKTGYSDHEIYRIASQDMVNSHSSGDLAHIAPIQRTTAGKLFTQFMTYQLNQWYSTKRDIFGIGNKDVSKLQALRQGVMFTVLAGLSNTVREVLGLPGMYPSPVTALAKGFLSDTGAVDWQLFGKRHHKPMSAVGAFVSAVAEMSKILPLGSSGYGAVLTTLEKAWSYGVDRQDYRKLAEYIARIGGIPGTSSIVRIIRIIERMNNSEREYEDEMRERRGEKARRRLDNNLTRKEMRADYRRERNKLRRRRPTR